LQSKEASTGSTIPYKQFSNPKSQKTKIFDPCYSRYRCEVSVVSQCS